MTDNKKLDLLYGALFATMCTGCAMLGHQHIALLPDDPNAPPPAGGPVTAILQAAAGLLGQSWAVPIIGAVGGVIGCSTNAHHGLRNVTVGAARMVARPFKGKSKSAKPTRS